MRVQASLLLTGVLVALLAGCGGSSNQDRTIKQLQATIAAQQQRASPQAQQAASPAAAATSPPTPAAAIQSPATAAAATHISPATAAAATPVSPSTARPASSTQAATAAPAQAAPATVSRSSRQFGIGATYYKTYALGNGLSLGMAQLYFENRANAPLPAKILDIKQIVIDSAEGKTSNGNYKVLPQKDGAYFYSTDLQNQFQQELSDRDINLVDLGTFDVPIGVENTFDAQKLEQGRPVRIPPGFTFRNVGYDIDNQVVVGFLFSSTVHPTQMHIIEHDATTYDVPFSDDGIFPNGVVPSAERSLVQIHTLAELAARTFETSEATLRFSGTCVAQDNQPALPITMTNKLGSTRAEGKFTLPFAAYFPDGIVAFDARGLVYSLGPGKSRRRSTGSTGSIPIPSRLPA